MKKKISILDDYEKLSTHNSDKFQIVENREIIIYKNGKLWKRFFIPEIKVLKKGYVEILYLLQKYSDFQVEEQTHHDNHKTKRNYPIKTVVNNKSNFPPKKAIITKPKEKPVFTKKITDSTDIFSESNEDNRLDDYSFGSFIKSNLKQNYLSPVTKLLRDSKRASTIEKEDKRNIDESEWMEELELYYTKSYNDIKMREAEERLLSGLSVYALIMGKVRKMIVYYKKDKLYFENGKNYIINLNTINKILINDKYSDVYCLQITLKNKAKIDINFNSKYDLECFIKGILSLHKNFNNNVVNLERSCRNFSNPRNLVRNRQSKVMKTNTVANTAKKSNNRVKNKKKIEIDYSEIDNTNKSVENYVDSFGDELNIGQIDKNLYSSQKTDYNSLFNYYNSKNNYFYNQKPLKTKENGVEKRNENKYKRSRQKSKQTENKEMNVSEYSLIENDNN